MYKYLCVLVLLCGCYGAESTEGLYQGDMVVDGHVIPSVIRFDRTSGDLDIDGCTLPLLGITYPSTYDLIGSFIYECDHGWAKSATVTQGDGLDPEVPYGEIRVRVEYIRGQDLTFYGYAL